MIDEQERLRRWRLVLGGDAASAPGGGAASEGIPIALSKGDQAIDLALAALYDPERQAGRGGSAPNIAR